MNVVLRIGKMITKVRLSEQRLVMRTDDETEVT